MENDTKKRKHGILKAVAAAVCVIILLFAVNTALKIWYWSAPYEPGADEIALKIRLDLDRDIGLLVLDYTAGGHEHSGGISNADRSMIKRDEEIVNVWSRTDLECDSDKVGISLAFRLVTEYTDPNFENIYPEEITVLLEPISWEAHFGQTYGILITPDGAGGYRAELTD